MMGDYVDQWIGVVGRLLSPAFPAEAIKPLTLSFAELLRKEFPRQAFTPVSAVRVAGAKRYGSLPSWDIVANELRAYIRENRPVNFGMLPAPREPDHPDPTPEQVAEVERIAAEYRQWRAEQEIPKVDRAKRRDVTLKGAELEMARNLAMRD